MPKGGGLGGAGGTPTGPVLRVEKEHEPHQECEHAFVEVLGIFLCEPFYAVRVRRVEATQEIVQGTENLA